MKDEFHDVRLNIVAHAGLLCEVLGVDGLINHLLHTIQSLIMDNHWRIRQSVVEQVPKLAKLFGVDLFQSKLEALFLSSLRDSVHSVRQEAIKHLEFISTTFGNQWTVEHLMPKITEQYSQSVGYANRVTTIEVLPKVAKEMTPEQIENLIVPLLEKATKDSVPNVRFSACRKIVDLWKEHKDKPDFIKKPEVMKKLRDGLERLRGEQGEPDSDVIYYANDALLKMGQA